MSQGFLDAVKGRRTIYHIKPEVSVSNDKIKEVIDQAVLHCPSSFNVQSARVRSFNYDDSDITPSDMHH